MNPRINVLLVVAALLPGCAAMSDAECRSADWYELGYRDARFRLQDQHDIYARQCEHHGVKIDATRYEQGLRQGRYDFPSRMI